VSAGDLAGWSPVALRTGPGVPSVEWCYTAGVGFDDPFFEQTVERCLRDLLRLLFLRQTSLETLVEAAGGLDSIEPSGFVFHMSRCGSTLAAQMLAATGTTLVVSEAEPLETIAGSAGWMPSVEDRVACLRAMVAALGQRRTPAQRHLVVKFDAWSVFDLPLILRAFPGVPWAFMFRDPAEVLSSQMRQRGSRLIPGVLPESVTGISAEHALAMPPEEFCAAVLTGICEAALEHADDRVLFVDYEELPEAVPDVLASWFGIPPAPGERSRMLDRAGADAKAPSLPFDRGLRGAGGGPVREAARRMAPVYERMRTIARRAA
jgi:hypothetical protein